MFSSNRAAAMPVPRQSTQRKWGLSWQIAPRALTDAMAHGGDVAQRAFAAMMTMQKIDVAKIEAAVKG